MAAATATNQPGHHRGSPSELLARFSASPRNTQRRRTLRLLLSWAFTTILAVAVFVLVKSYQTKGVLKPSQKNAYSFLSMGLVIFLGASLLETLKELAKNLRYHIDHWFKPPSKNQKLVEGFDSLLNVLRLVRFASTQKLRLICILWLFINLSALIAPALQSLICTLEDGRDYDGIYVQDGLSIVPNITCYNSGHACAPNQAAMDQLAHAYGETTLGADSTDPDNCGNFTDVQSIIDSEKDYRYFCRRSTKVQEFGIRFNEYNIDDIRRTYPHFTRRVVKASSGQCNEYSPVGNSEPAIVGDPKRDGTNFISAFNYTYAINTTSNGSIVIPTSALGHEGTTYIYRGVHRPQNETRYGYGPRGLWMWAYRNPGQNRTPLFYECPITIDPVANVVHSAHNISDSMAREATASIALQGQFKGKYPDPVFTQWQWYADQHTWNIRNDTSKGGVGANMAEHAIISLAEMLANSPKIQAPGTVPYLGSKLKVDWWSFVALMAGIIGCDSLASVLGLLAIWKGPKSESGQWVKLQSADTEHHGEDRRLVGSNSDR